MTADVWTMATRGLRLITGGLAEEATTARATGDVAPTSQSAPSGPASSPHAADPLDGGLAGGPPAAGVSASPVEQTAEVGAIETRVSLAGLADVVLDPLGVLWWPARRTLVVSDLHFEHASSFARRRTFLPPYDTGPTLARLTLAIERYAPDTVIALGDSFHDAGGPARMAPQHYGALREMVRRRSWIWITGNHDDAAATVLGGKAMDAFSADGVTFRHIPGAAPETPEVAGHLHPAARISRRGRSLRRRCFVGCGRRLVMPAFGALTGGLNLLDPAFRTLWTSPLDPSVFMIGRDAVYQIAPRELLPG